MGHERVIGGCLSKIIRRGNTMTCLKVLLPYQRRIVPKGMACTHRLHPVWLRRLHSVSAFSWILDWFELRWMYVENDFWYMMVRRAYYPLRGRPRKRCHSQYASYAATVFTYTDRHIKLHIHTCTYITASFHASVQYTKIKCLSVCISTDKVTFIFPSAYTITLWRTHIEILFPHFSHQLFKT